MFRTYCFNGVEFMLWVSSDKDHPCNIFINKDVIMYSIMRRIGAARGSYQEYDEGDIVEQDGLLLILSSHHCQDIFEFSWNLQAMNITRILDIPHNSPRSFLHQACTD